MEEISMDKKEIVGILTRIQDRLIELEIENDLLKKKLKAVEDEVLPYVGGTVPAGRVLTIIRRK
jgi:hypothetical protein